MDLTHMVISENICAVVGYMELSQTKLRHLNERELKLNWNSRTRDMEQTRHPKILFISQASQGMLCHSPSWDEGFD